MIVIGDKMKFEKLDSRIPQTKGNISRFRIAGGENTWIVISDKIAMCYYHRSGNIHIFENDTTSGGYDSFRKIPK